MIQRPRLLMIDHDLDFRRKLLPKLRRQFFVMEACDGEEGYQRALATTPDVVLMDIDIEGCRGIETLRRFRECPRLTSIPLIVVTWNNRREIVEEAIRSGATDYILKASVEPEGLSERVLQLLPLAANA